MSLAKNKLVDDDLDSSSDNEEKETTNDNCIPVMMPMAMVRRLVDDDLDSSASSDTESESETGNGIAAGPSTSVKISELKDDNLSEKDKDVHHNNDNDNINIISKNIELNTTEGEHSRLSSTDSDEDCGGPSCNFDDSDLDELEDKKYRPKQSKQSKTKKKTKKNKTQKSGIGSNKNNDKNPNQHSDDGEIEIKTTVPLSSAVGNSGRKNNQSRRSANQKPRQYRRDRTERNVSTQKPPKIPNIPHPHGHVEVKRVTANDAIDILERMKARLAVDSDQESDNKKTGSGAKGVRVGGGKGGKEICSVLVIRKKPEYCSDNE